jgi:hypothetical protein
MPTASSLKTHHESRYIINHDIKNCTADGVVGNHLYSGRALGISSPSDIIQLHPDLRVLWSDITGHYLRVGLDHSHDVIWNLDLHQLAKHVGHKPSVFFYGRKECRNWGDDKWLETVEFINSKNNFMAVAHQLGVDTPNTRCYDCVSRISQSDIETTIYPCYLKAAISVSGVGIYRCERPSELRSAMSQFTQGIPIQIQEEVNAEYFLNLQYQIADNQLSRLAATEQILDGFTHQGNRYPASFEPWDSVHPMAEWMKDNGMKGIFAFDVAVTLTEQGLRFPAIECNPRYNGASYPTLIANKLGIPEWTAVNFSSSYRRLIDIDLRDLEYNDETKEGIVIINWGTILAGKLMLLIAGSRDYQESMMILLESRLNPTTKQ